MQILSIWISIISPFFANDNLQITISNIQFNHPPYEIRFRIRFITVWSWSNLHSMILQQFYFWCSVYILSYHKRANGNLEGWNCSTFHKRSLWHYSCRCFVFFKNICIWSCQVTLWGRLPQGRKTRVSSASGFKARGKHAYIVTK